MFCYLQNLFANHTELFDLNNLAVLNYKNDNIKVTVIVFCRVFPVEHAIKVNYVYVCSKMYNNIFLFKLKFKVLTNFKFFNIIYMS